MREKNRFHCLASGVLSLLVLGVGIQTPGANAAQEPDSFAGRTVRIIVPYAPGAAFDRLARFVGQRIGDHLSGNPSIIVQNMPGGGGAVATNYLYNVAPVAAALSAPDEVMRTFALPPGVSARRVRALRQAFQKVLEDAQLKELIKKSGDELSPSPGEHLEEVMRKVISDTPKESIAAIKRLFGG